MTQSLPGTLRTSRVKDAVLDVATKATLNLLPRTPDRVKRLLLGGRSITVDGNTLDTTMQLMLAGQRAAGMRGLFVSDDVAVSRAELDKTVAMLTVDLPVDVTDLSLPGPAGDLPARHYRATERDAPLLVFFHGGAFVLGGLDSHDSLCRLICRDGQLNVLAVDYRLAPEHKAPAAADDAYAAYRWAADHAAELGADPARIAVGGDSAGGNLAAVVSQRSRNDDVPLPTLQLLIYPVTDLCSATRSKTLFAEGYFLTNRDMELARIHYTDGAAVEPTDPVVAPLLAEDLSGLPPAMVLTAGFDPLRDEGHQYAEAMRAAGVPVDHRQYGSLIHGFASFFSLGGGSAHATAEMISALRAHLSRR
ncbi:alpha/beta hydrolase [Mycobacterium hubeiense]|uniref:alpha/beta hydrolase n=1 Tax=Mycobacterium hubeiense TaxID=1867256 RepID=UPI000C7EFBE3|nr:alpha/beta hydrolase [Mycobacterium sp. QGD 101]